MHSFTRRMIPLSVALLVLTWTTVAAGQDKEAQAALQLAERGATVKRADDRPGKPVVEVILKTDDLETLDLLAALSHLEGLDLRSSLIDDRGLTRLKPL